MEIDIIDVWIIAIRRNKITQKDVAHEANLSYTQFSKIMRRHVKPRQSTIKKVNAAIETLVG